MPRIYTIILFFSVMSLTAQENGQIASVNDSLYREDQIYIGFTYNLVSGSPDEVKGAQFSGGIHSGFIRDFPINERRNIALGIGLGYSFNSYGQNLFIGEEEGTKKSIFRILDQDEVEYDKNRFSTHAIDVPIQFRWRTSTMDSYKFWRVYAGLRSSYVYSLRTNFEQPGNTVRQTDVPEFNRLRVGATFTFGYNTFNFHFYYSLNSFFNEEATVNGERIDMRTFQVGLMFYLL